jgi:hypothetical protein
VKVRVTDPNGNASGWINQDDPPYEMTATSPGAPVLCRLTFDGPTVTGTRPRIVIFVAPTGVFDLSDPSEQVAPSGVWKIEVINFGAAVEVAAWIQRDDTPFGWPILGRQSYFDDPQYQRFDPFGRDRETDSGTSYVRRFGTLNAIATGTTPVVIAGFRRSDRTPAKYSAAGPILKPAKAVAGGRPGADPNAMAISDDSVVCEGVLAAGTRSNAVFPMNGTSVAAPQITRWIAGKMLAGTKQVAEGVKAPGHGHPLTAVERGASRINCRRLACRGGNHERGVGPPTTCACAKSLPGDPRSLHCVTDAARE